MGTSSRHRLTLTASRIAIVAAAMALGGCSGLGFITGSNEGEAPQLVMPNPQDSASSAAYWGAIYDTDRNNFEAAVKFARNLRQVGGAAQAVTLLKEVVMRAPDNAAVLAEYGKALIEVGRPADALPFFGRATQTGEREWSILSAYAVALDQTGSHTQAQAQYEAALDLSPDNPIVMGNLAMSHVLEGNLARGEEILRKLVARPDATPQMRQNLAMIASLRGNRSEAENLSRQDLSPADTQNNLAVMQQLSIANTPTTPTQAGTTAPGTPAAPVASPSMTAPEPAPVTIEPAAPAPAAEPVPDKAASLIAPPDSLLARPAEESVVPLAKPRDMSALPMPASMRGEQGPATAPITEVTPAAAPAPRRAIATMRPIADDPIVSPAAPTVAAANEVMAPTATSAAPQAQPTPLRRSLAADTLPASAEGIEVAASAY